MNKSKQHNQIINIVSRVNIQHLSKALFKYNTLALTLLAVLSAMLTSGCGRSFSGVDYSKPQVDTAAIKLLSIPKDLLSRAGLHQQWTQPKFSLGFGRQINQLFYRGGKLFIADNQGTLYAIDGQNGLPLWSKSLSNIQSPCSAPEFYQNHILFVVDNTIVEINTDGEIINTLNLEFSPSTTVTRNKDSYFLGSSDKRFYSLEIDGGIKNWQSIQPSTPIGHIQVYVEPLDENIIDKKTGEPVVPFEKVFYTAKDGRVYVSLTGKRERVWIKESSGEASGVIVDNNQCFLPSSDTVLYCFNSSDGELLWRYMASAPLTKMPALCSNYLYQSIGFDSLACLDRQSGREAWKLKNGKTMLAENGPLCYALTHNNELAVINNLTGKHQMSFYIPGIEMTATNTEDNMIFLATRRGTIVALKPDRQKSFHRTTQTTQNDQPEEEVKDTTPAKTTPAEKVNKNNTISATTTASTGNNTSGTAAKWTDNLSGVTIPNKPVAGMIAGKPFKIDAAELSNGILVLRQGKDSFADLQLLIYLFTEEGEDLSGKTFNIRTDSGFGSPHIHMEWKTSNEDEPESEDMMDRYSMQLNFGQIKNGKITGKIYVCLPDKNKSFAAGTFEATIK